MHKLVVGTAFWLIALLATTTSATYPLMIKDGGVRNSWEYGTIETGAGAGSVGWATDLDDDYRNSSCGGLANTAPIPGALIVADPVMELTHGFHFEKSPFGTVYDAGAIVVSKDGGGTFSHLPGPAYNVFGYVTNYGLRACLLDIYGIGQGLGLYSGKVATTTETIDLSGAGIGPADLVVIKFVAATDTYESRDGWAITGLSVAGVPLVVG